MKKGQYFRLLLSSTANPTKVIAAAKQMSLHLSAQTEESSTKDTTGDALEYEVVGQSYEITGSALVITDNDTLGGSSANTLDTMLDLLGDTLLYWKICLMEGTNNRTVSTEVFNGTAKLTNLQVDAPNRQNTTYSYTLTGYGALAVSSAASSGGGGTSQQG